MGLEKVQLFTTLDRPYTILASEDPLYQHVVDFSRVVEAYVLPKDPCDIDEKLEFGGQIVHVYEDDTLYVFEVPLCLDLNPHFKEGEVVDVVGLNGTIRWRTTIRTINSDYIVTSCERRWTLDGKRLGSHGAYSDIQLRRHLG